MIDADYCADDEITGHAALADEHRRGASGGGA